MPEAGEMHLAEVLSDLVSLRAGVCDPAAALALVSARPSSSAAANEPTSASAQDDDDDKDLQRARELVELHYDVRERCRRGELSHGLAEARSMVERAVG